MNTEEIQKEINKVQTEIEASSNDDNYRIMLFFKIKTLKVLLELYKKEVTLEKTAQEIVDDAVANIDLSNEEIHQYILAQKPKTRNEYLAIAIVAQIALSELIAYHNLLVITTPWYNYFYNDCVAWNNILSIFEAWIECQETLPDVEFEEDNDQIIMKTQLTMEELEEIIKLTKETTNDEFDKIKILSCAGQVVKGD